MEDNNTKTEREQILEIAKASAANMSADKKSLTFDVDKNGYKGTFVCKYPSLMDKMKIGVVRADFLKGLVGQVDVVTDNIAYITSTMSVTCTQAPNWWNINTLDDYDVLMEVWSQYNTELTTFRTGTN